MLDNELLLQCGNDIPFQSGLGIIHQPTIKEIGYIGEDVFQIGSRFLLFNKNDLILKDKSVIENQSNFYIFMSVMNSAEKVQHKVDAIKVLNLLFPNSTIKIQKDKILIKQANIETSITEQNFNEFQDIIRQAFCLDTMSGGNSSYNPKDQYAQKIAEKLAKRHDILNKQKGNKKINLFSQYISILSVGLQKDKNQLSGYTIYQLFDEFQRFQAKEQFDIYIRAKMAGATDLEEVKNWMEDFHLKNKN